MDLSSVEVVLFSVAIVLVVMVLTQGQQLSNVKDRLARVERVVRPGTPVEGTGLSPEVEFEVRTLVDAGKKIQAIKLVRERTGLGLKESKDLVDQF